MKAKIALAGAAACIAAFLSACSGSPSYVAPVVPVVHHHLVVHHVVTHRVIHIHPKKRITVVHRSSRHR